MEGTVVAREEVAEDEGFEEPGGVGEVPLGGARLGTGLDHHVLGGERATELEAGGADGAEAAEKRGLDGGGGLGRHALVPSMQRKWPGRRHLCWMRMQDPGVPFPWCGL